MTRHAPRARAPCPVCHVLVPVVGRKLEPHIIGAEHGGLPKRCEGSRAKLRRTINTTLH